MKFLPVQYKAMNPVLNNLTKAPFPMPYCLRMFRLKVMVWSVTQSCLALCNLMNCSLARPLRPWDSPGKDLEWVAVPFPEDLPHPGIEHRSPELQAGSLFSEQPSSKIRVGPDLAQWRPLGKGRCRPSHTHNHTQHNQTAHNTESVHLCLLLICLC